MHIFTSTNTSSVYASDIGGFLAEFLTSAFRVDNISLRLSAGGAKIHCLDMAVGYFVSTLAVTITSIHGLPLWSVDYLWPVFKTMFLFSLKLGLGDETASSRLPNAGFLRCEMTGLSAVIFCWNFRRLSFGQYFDRGVGDNRQAGCYPIHFAVLKTSLMHLHLFMFTTTVDRMAFYWCDADEKILIRFQSYVSAPW